MCLPGLPHMLLIAGGCPSDGHNGAAEGREKAAPMYDAADPVCCNRCTVQHCDMAQHVCVVTGGRRRVGEDCPRELRICTCARVRVRVRAIVRVLGGRGGVAWGRGYWDKAATTGMPVHGG